MGWNPVSEGVSLHSTRNIEIFSLYYAAGLSTKSALVLVEKGSYLSNFEKEAVVYCVVKTLRTPRVLKKLSMS